MSETAQAETGGLSGAEKVTRYFAIGGVLLILSLPSALVVFGWIPNSYTADNLILGVLNLSVNVLVSVLNAITPLNLGYPSFVLPPESQIYFAALGGFYTLVFLLAGAIGRPGNPRDYFGGAALVAVAIFAYLASRDLGGMRGFAFGPGTAPRIFSYALGGIGLLVAATGIVTKGPAIDRFHFRGPIFVTLSVLVFALTVRSFGLAVSSFLSICAAAAATPDARVVETLACAVVLTAFCCFLFPYALNLPMQLWPISYDPVVLIKGISFR